ncbi:MAG TPA: long-chain fatty acid--CoA ligase, partial [Armatimonadetes bacterium]|nr:long-chain fatty acid--CoA ligase [Armatimonadota bacterium]
MLDFPSLGHMLRHTAAQHPTKAAVIFQGEATAYQALEVMSNKVARALAERGLGRGDHVGLYCINSPHFVASYLGIVKQGATVVPINLLLNPEEVHFILSDSRAKALIYFEQLAPAVAAIRERLPDLQYLIAVGDSGGLPADTFAAIMARGEQLEELPAIDRREDVAAILYTSGTTGRPKGAMLTHHNLLSNVASINQALYVSPDDVFLTILPMFHAFAATVGMLTPLSKGAAIAAVPRFTPEEMVRAMAETKATIFFGVPSMYAVLVNLPEGREPDMSSLRLCISGGAALPVEVMKRFEERYGVPIYEGDGPTECSPVTCVNPIGGLRKPGSVGQPIPGVEMKIVDEEGNELPTGEVGEIVVRGDNVMKGYFNLPEETKEAFLGEWFRTGDLGYVDEDGYFYIVDRKKDLIIVSG